MLSLICEHTLSDTKSHSSDYPPAFFQLRALQILQCEGEAEMRQPRREAPGLCQMVVLLGWQQLILDHRIVLLARVGSAATQFEAVGGFGRAGAARLGPEDCLAGVGWGGSNTICSEWWLARAAATRFDLRLV